MSAIRPDGDELGDDEPEEAEVDDLAPGDTARDTMLPPAGVGSTYAPQLEATVLNETYAGEPERESRDERTGDVRD